MSSINSPEYKIEDKDCNIYYDPHVTAIHVSPDDNPVISDCDCITFLHFLRIDKNNTEKNIVLFGGDIKMIF